MLILLFAKRAKVKSSDNILFFVSFCLERSQATSVQKSSGEFYGCRSTTFWGVCGSNFFVANGRGQYCQRNPFVLGVCPLGPLGLEVGRCREMGEPRAQNSRRFQLYLQFFFSCSRCKTQVLAWSTFWGTGREVQACGAVCRLARTVMRMYGRVCKTKCSSENVTFAFQPQSNLRHMGAPTL